MPSTITRSGTMRYGPGVLTGNWFEDMCVAEERLRRFTTRNRREKLLVEKARCLYDNFYKEVTLEAPKKYLKFGTIVQLLPMHINLDQIDVSAIRATLSITVSESVLRHSQCLNDECELSVAPSNNSIMRNSFRIVSADELSPESEHLKYGQNFRLQCVEPKDDPIWLYSAPKLNNLSQSIVATFQSYNRGELNLPVGLVYCRNCGPESEVPRGLANWFCLHTDSKKRFESEGLDVPSNTPLVIVHTATNKNLAVENVYANTLFGPEFLVSVQSYKNRFKQDLWKNIWMISNGMDSQFHA